MAEAKRVNEQKSAAKSAVKSAATREALARAAQVLRAIEMRGGEVVETRSGDARSVAAVDMFGGEVERFDVAAVDALRSSGQLTVKRFERGGVVLGLSSGSAARVAYFSGD